MGRCDHGTTGLRGHGIMELWDKVKGTPWEPIPGREGVEVASRVDMLPAPVEVPALMEAPRWEQ